MVRIIFQNLKQKRGLILFGDLEVFGRADLQLIEFFGGKRFRDHLLIHDHMGYANGLALFIILRQGLNMVVGRVLLLFRLHILVEVILFLLHRRVKKDRIISSNL